MPIHGLYIRHAALLRSHASHTAAANDPENIRGAEYEDRANMTKRQATRVREHIDDNLASIGMIEILIDRMQLTDAPKSADRRLAIQHLEDASMRLRRELGDQPELTPDH